MSSLFHTWCATAQRIGQRRDAVEKIALAAGYFATLSPSALDLAACYLCEGAFAQASGRRVALGSATIGRFAAHFCEIDYDAVFRPCRAATGSGSETIEKLLANLDAARAKMSGRVLSLADVHAVFGALYRARHREEKEAILASTWSRMTPLEVRCFLHILGKGSLRIGFDEGDVLAALALAFEADPGAIRRAHMRTGSVGRTAVLAQQQALDDARFRLFRPVALMLASPLYDRRNVEACAYLAEEMFDGMRCQVHAQHERVVLFSRDGKDVSPVFPEVVEGLARCRLDGVVLDGQLVVFERDAIQSSQRLQQRMGVPKPTREVCAAHPVCFVAYDLMAHHATPAVDLPLEQRRAFLEALALRHGFPVAVQFDLAAWTDVDALVDHAIAHGNAGVMLKRRGSLYDHGQRGNAWLTVKRPLGTLDTVILYAHADPGARAELYNDFTLGIRVDDDERFDETFIPISRAAAGCSNDELSRLTQALRPLIRERYGATLALKPQIVVTLEFDDVQINRRTKANFALGLPRFKAVRWDRAPNDIDTLKMVEALYRHQLQRERLTQSDGDPSFRVPTLPVIQSSVGYTTRYGPLDP